MERQFEENDDMQIDLVALLKALKKKLWLIVICLIAGAAAFGIYTAVLVTPIYSSSTMLYITGSSSAVVSVSDLQLGSQLAGDYEVLVKSRPNLEAVITNLGLNMTYEQLNSCVSVSNQDETRILRIKVSHPVPQTAKEIADELASVTIDSIPKIMSAERPTLVEGATLPKYPDSPSLKKNIILGGLAGAFAAAAVISVMFIMNDKIRSEEDIERYLGLNTLALIPEVGNKNKSLSLPQKTESNKHRKAEER